MDFKITEQAEATLRKQLQKAGESAVVTIDDARGC
jgi:putative transposon-encoded protein